MVCYFDGNDLPGKAPTNEKRCSKEDLQEALERVQKAIDPHEFFDPYGANEPDDSSDTTPDSKSEGTELVCPTPKRQRTTAEEETVGDSQEIGGAAPESTGNAKKRWEWTKDKVNKKSLQTLNSYIPHELFCEVWEAL